MQVSGPAKQKDSGNKEQMAERQRRKQTRKRKLEFSSSDSKAGGEPMSPRSGPPPALFRVRWIAKESLVLVQLEGAVFLPVKLNSSPDKMTAQ